MRSGPRAGLLSQSFLRRDIVSESGGPNNQSACWFSPGLSWAQEEMILNYVESQWFFDADNQSQEIDLTTNSISQSAKQENTRWPLSLSSKLPSLCRLCPTHPMRFPIQLLGTVSVVWKKACSIKAHSRCPRFKDQK